MNGGPNWAYNFVDSPIIVNKETDEFYKNPMYYALGHVSRFAPEGSVRIEAQVTNAPSKLDTVAFLREDGGVAVIAINRYYNNKVAAIKN